MSLAWALAKARRALGLVAGGLEQVEAVDDAAEGVGGDLAERWSRPRWMQAR
jgi:hypothetical protein